MGKELQLWNEEQKSCLNELKFWKLSRNSKPSKFCTISVAYLIWNLKIVQDPKNKDQGDLCSPSKDKAVFSGAQSLNTPLKVS